MDSQLIRLNNELNRKRIDYIEIHKTLVIRIHE